jgi:hypothetical protein
VTKGFRSLGELIEGDVVEFDARVTPYKKGYRGRNYLHMVSKPPTIDYRLSRPTRVVVSGHTREEPGNDELL